MRIATSLISVEQAKRNLELEIAAGDTFESLRERAQKQWDDKLGRDRGRGRQRGPAHHPVLQPLPAVPLSQRRPREHGHARAPGVPVRQPLLATPPAARPTRRPARRSSTGKVYVNNGFWDTFRTAWPAYTLLAPAHGRRADRRLRAAVQGRRLGGPLVVARLREPHGRHQLRRGLRRRLREGRDRLRRERRLRGRAQERGGGAAQRQRRAQGPRHLDLPRLHQHRRPTRAPPGRWTATSTTSASPTWRARWPPTRSTAAADQRRYLEEHEYYLDRALRLREHVRSRHSASSRAAARTDLAPAARAVRPARVGPRLHGDQRLELRLHRAPRRPGPGQPLRRAGQAGGQARRLLRHPETAAGSRAPTAASSTR